MPVVSTPPPASRSRSRPNAGSRLARHLLGADETRRRRYGKSSPAGAPVDTTALLPEAWGLRRNVTVPDALYVVIARRLQVAPLTGDTRLARAPGLGVSVLTSMSSPLK